MSTFIPESAPLKNDTVLRSGILMSASLAWTVETRALNASVAAPADFKTLGIRMGNRDEIGGVARWQAAQ
jgi:hypothetical protein